LGVPSKGTDRRGIRVDRSLWQRFGQATVEREDGRSGVLREFMRWYLGDEGAQLPQRPSDAEQQPPG
jgi:hypothetical protein